MKMAKVTSPYINSSFLVIKAEKHYAVHNHDQTEAGCARPGEFIVLDKNYCILVFTRDQFKKAFGHKSLQQMESL